MSRLNAHGVQKQVPTVNTFIRSHTGVVERVVYGEPAGPVVRAGRVALRDPSGQCEQAGLIGRPAALHDRGHGEDRVPEAARHAGPVQERQLASS